LSLVVFVGGLTGCRETIARGRFSRCYHSGSQGLRFKGWREDLQFGRGAVSVLMATALAGLGRR